jgi:hypothetical protein
LRVWPGITLESCCRVYRAPEEVDQKTDRFGSCEGEEGKAYLGSC